MITRRGFVPVVAGGLLASRSRADELAVCRDVDYRYPATYSPALWSGAAKWKPPRAGSQPPPQARRLWSKMSAQEQTDLTNKLHAAYDHIAAAPKLDGWRGQGWLHKYFCSTLDVHASSAFLPWHRAFLYFHEKLLQTYDKKLMLPVWDWENCKDVPSAYENWVKIPFTTTDCNYVRGKVPFAIDDCMLQAWLLSSNPAEFLGPARVGTPGTSYNGPHTLVHSNLGGFMKVSHVAALDPLFYSHHANMDRYFAAWRKCYRDDPAFAHPQWPGDTWYFYDATVDAVVKVHGPEFANRHLDDTESLGYYYDTPAEIPLFDFDALSGIPIGTFLTLKPQSVLDFLNRLKQSMQSASSIRSAAAALLQYYDQIMQLFSETVEQSNLTFPLHVVLRVPTGELVNGNYYAIGVQPVIGPAPETIAAVGGFGVFGHIHGSVWSTPVALCLKPEIFRLILTYTLKGGAQLVYGDLSSDGQSVLNPKKVNGIASFEIRYPKDLATFLPH